MKKAGFLAATVASASTAALATSGSEPHRSPSQNEGSAFSMSKGAGSGSRKRGDEGFAPRFDGLRFIETLVTAHR